ncbi:Eukaryotic translation initiation factor 4B [Microtus ochrogaster]|uniref:Eukaryotic translation initiation factor 4B n=1 Tax=Microtus ochrogaster TaxID=79684 RepID=A0A8J6KXJ6_MICOH|nr:Eukaryotic translation initiation factor 4B [Microtus ochrogaster]
MIRRGVKDAHGTNDGAYRAPPTNHSDDGAYRAPPTNHSDDGPYRAPPTNHSDDGPYRAPPTNHSDDGAYRAPPTNHSILSTALQAAQKPNTHQSCLPNLPPCTVSLGDLPCDVTEDSIRSSLEDEYQCGTLVT